MTTMTKQEAFQDEKVREVLEKFKEGRTRDEVSEGFGYKNYKSLDMYMRRKGFGWDDREQTYKWRAESPKEETPVDRTKAGKVVMLLKNDDHNVRTVARTLKFTNYMEMAAYMKGQGYEWNEEEENYVKRIGVVEPSEEVGKAPEEEPRPEVADTTPEPVEVDGYDSILRFIKEHEHRLRELLSSDHLERNTATLPRYTLSGAPSTKTIQMMTSLKQVVATYSQEYNIRQRDMFEVAIIDFLDKYGYKEQVDILLNRK